MIYLVRHGETVWNTLGRYQGIKDSPLTSHGVRQANIVATLLKREIAGSEQSLEFCVSPLGRTQQTAAILQSILPLHKNDDERLMEVSVGSWDGLTKFEIEHEFPRALCGSTAYDWYFKSPDGEKLDQVCNRARAWLATVRTPTIAVSHGLFGRILRGVYLDISIPEMLELEVPQDGFFVLDKGCVRAVCS
ncbi:MULTISPECIES: histidine phosphatase family protein [Agrobacterium]|nr:MULTISPECIES: histidine phosphatase family protein [Agrobacterium]MCZ7887056.1 phosphoglycerate mutase family protein [Agrobacterium salinitolerans]MDA5630436.1 phosphoglycerate mutase family protein [Agrobacterium sp. ST15.16.055]MDA6980284.1 phosphoglycerate mutase family protein [Agrobacterium salinitolerans]